jgi:hypothetical protein
MPAKKKTAAAAAREEEAEAPRPVSVGRIVIVHPGPDAPSEVPAIVTRVTDGDPAQRCDLTAFPPGGPGIPFMNVPRQDAELGDGEAASIARWRWPERV